MSDLRAAAAAAALVLLTASACAPGPDRAPVLAGAIFGPGSEWRRDVSDAPLHPDSAALVAGLVGQVSRYYGTAAFNVHQYNTSLVVADRDTPRRDVAFDDCQDKGYVPEQLYSPRAGAHFADVPIPDDAVPAAGTDAQLTVLDPDSDQLWEFWQARRTDDGWAACWGGRIDDVTNSPGWFPDGMGASASGLATVGGMVRIAEARAGEVDHALSLALPEVADWSVVSWPAQRSDGWNPDAEPHRIPEGLRLRLDPTLDVDSLQLTPIAAMIARAAQRYGFIVTDRSGAVAVVAENGAPAEQVTGEDPWGALLGDAADYEVMAGFPWDRVQALPLDHGRP